MRSPGTPMTRFTMCKPGSVTDRNTNTSPSWGCRYFTNGAHDVFGEKVTRSTTTWSPMSSVSSMEADGISKFWKMKVMMKSRTTSTADVDPMNSIEVSRFFSGFGFLDQNK